MSTNTLNIHTFMTKNSVYSREPASPTFSVASSFSWIAERSTAEIKHIFKSTFNSLAEKERGNLFYFYY
jgi:hypothetical protein